MLYLWYFLFGYVIINVELLGVERLLNAAAKEGLQFLELQRKSYTQFRAKLSVRDYKKLQKMLPEQAKVIVEKRGGGAAVLDFLRRRWILGVGAALTICVVVILSLFCVRIRVEGLTSISEYDVYLVMQEAGAKEFALKSRIDTKKLERAIWNAFPDLTYVYVSFDGASLVAEIRERTPKPEIREEQPCAVYALKSGVIEQVIVTGGQAVVAEGEQVSEGQLLIAGNYLKGETPISMPARGVVIARVDYIAKAEATISSYDKVPTGETAVERYMLLGKQKIHLLGENPFPEFIEKDEVVGEIGKNGPLHLQIIEKTYYKAKSVYSPEKKQAALVSAEEKAYQSLYAQMPEDAEIVAFHRYEEEQNGKLSITLTVSVREAIGMTGVVNDAPQIPSADTQE